MGKGLLGKHVAIGGSRKTEEISTIIEKQGGIPVIRPLQGTVYLAEKQVEPDLRTFVEGKKLTGSFSRQASGWRLLSIWQRKLD